MQASDIQQTVDKAVDKAIARELQPAVDKAVTRAIGPAVAKAVGPAVDKALDKKFGPMMDRRFAEWEARFDERSAKLIEDTAGFIYEKQKHDFGLVLEATDFIKQRLDEIPTREEFSDLKSEVRIIRKAVIATNQDVHEHDQRISDLENEVFYS